MARIRELTIQCGFCTTRHQSRAFAETGALESALAAGYTAKCPKCGKDILCNKANTTWSVEESGPAGAIEFK
jgi:hypothetical protein